MNTKTRKRTGRTGGRLAGNAVLLAAAAQLVFPGAAAQAAEVPKGTISVTNVTETEANVTAYPIVTGTYSAEGKLTGYVLTDAENGKLADMQQPTAKELADIADYIEENPGAVTGTALTLTDAEKGTWTLETEPGEYLILVTGSGDTIYNPAVVSVNVTDAERMDLEDGSVDFGGSFFESGSRAYLKSSRTDLQKTVLRNGEQVRGRSAAIGESMEFVIDSMNIPSYSDSYETVVFRIRDELEGGCFGAIHDLKVLVDEEEVAAGEDTWRVTYGSGKTSFAVEFADSYLRSHGTKPVAIHYCAELTGNAGLNFAENTNRAVLEYSCNPADAREVREKTAVSYQYTFGLGANIDAEGEKEQQIETNEINKVTKTDSAYETTEVTGSGTGATTTVRSKYALEGAGFTMYRDKEMTKEVAAAVSDANGHLTFTGLAEGEYYLKETETPKGYAANETVYHVVISAQYREDGSLEEYTVTTGQRNAQGAEEEAGTFTYKAVSAVEADGSITNTITSRGEAAEILNVPLTALPSAGGGGTFGFVLAAAGMSGGLVVWKLVHRLQNNRPNNAELFSEGACQKRRQRRASGDGARA